MMVCSVVHGTAISRIRLQSRKPTNIAALYSARQHARCGAGRSFAGPVLFNSPHPQAPYC
jgi:hypothetical protein